MSADELFRRNFNFARSIAYDLHKVHSDHVCHMIRTNAECLLLDEQMLSLTLRSTAAFHLDKAKVHIDNDANREKHIVDFTLIITSIGSGKSTIFTKLTQATNKREKFEAKRQASTLPDSIIDNNVGKKKQATKKNDEKEKHDWTRHSITNDFTGAGIFKSLSDTGNVLILVDEFDSEHQKSNIFTIDNKSGSNPLISANGLFKTLHTGTDSYNKVRAEGQITLLDPHVTILGASNGSVVIDIIRQKLKVSNVPDAMVERFQWEALLTSTKLNSTRLVNVPRDSIGLELYFLASSLLTNHIFVFDADANIKMCNWMDELAIARSRWDLIDSWLSSRLAKSIDQTARIAAEMSHIELTMILLKDFVSTHNINAFGSISFETYCQLVDFIQVKYPPQSSTLIHITAIYSMSISILKYINLFNIDLSTTCSIIEIPMHPPNGLDANGNPSVSNLPPTQQLPASHVQNNFLDFQKKIMLFPSISFTRTMLYGVQKLKSKKDLLGDLLSSLLEIGLLKQFDKGVITGARSSTVYIKSLPPTETLNTTNRFTLEFLDPINLPWLWYRPTCTNLLLPSTNSTFSKQVDDYLKQDMYQQIITRKGVYKDESSTPISSSQPSSLDQTRLNNQSIDSEETPALNTTNNVNSSSRASLNSNMPRPANLASGGFEIGPLRAHTNERLGIVNNLEQDGLNRQQQKAHSSENSDDNHELHDENQISSHLMLDNRRSSRIRKRQHDRTASNNVSVKKKR